MTGGLTLLPPYILTAGQQRLEFEVKVFYLVNGKDELDTETRKMVQKVYLFGGYLV